MRVLIVGGTRFIGPFLVRWLLDAGHEVTVFHRGVTEGEDLGVPHLHGDRAHLAEYRDELRATRAEVVIDMIAQSSADAHQGLVACQDWAAHLIVASSVDVYASYEKLTRARRAEPIAGPLGEQSLLRATRFPRRSNAVDPSDWRHNYDKILVEQTYRRASIPVTMLRLPFVFGPGDYRGRVEAYLEPMDQSAASITLSPDRARWRCTRGYVRDVAACIARVATAPGQQHRVFNVGDTRTWTEREWVEAIARAAGWCGELVLRRASVRMIDWRHHLEMDTRAIREALPLDEPTPSEQAMSESVAWHRQVREQHGSMQYDRG